MTPKPSQPRPRAETTRSVTRSGDSARSLYVRGRECGLLTPVSWEQDQIGWKTQILGRARQCGRNRSGIIWLCRQKLTRVTSLAASAPAQVCDFQLFLDREPLSCVTQRLSGVSWCCSGSSFVLGSLRRLFWGFYFNPEQQVKGLKG